MPRTPGEQRCFRAAAKADFKAIQVLLHIDSDDHSTWRNLLDFDPLAKYAGYSYEDVVVRPTAEALRTTLKPSQKVRCRDRARGGGREGTGGGTASWEAAR